MGRIHLEKITPSDYEALYPIVVEEEPFAEGLVFEHMKVSMYGREGWTVWDEEKVVGVITLSMFRALHSVIVHAVVEKGYHGKWATLRVMRKMAQYLFEDLELRKLYSYAIPFKTYDAARMLEHMGFRVEGQDRQGGMRPDGTYYDIINYSMLREECPWLWDKPKLREWLKGRKGGVSA